LPYLDWTLTLFGDPLCFVSFPKKIEDKDDESKGIEDEGEDWQDMGKSIARVAAYLYKKEKESLEVLNEIVNQKSDELQLVLKCLKPADRLYSTNSEESRHSQLTNVVNSYFNYPEKRFLYWGLSVVNPTVNDYLIEKEYKVSRLLTEVGYSEIIADDNLWDEGSWEFDFVLRDDSFEAVNYHFILEIYIKPTYNHENLIISRDSIELKEWCWEEERYNFIPMTFEGVSSSHIGRKIRCRSRKDTKFISYNEYLVRGETYYYRVIQYNAETGEMYETREYTDIVYT